MNLENPLVLSGDLIYLQDLGREPKALLGDACDPKALAHCECVLIAGGLEHRPWRRWKDAASPRSDEPSREPIRFPRSRRRKTDRNVNSDDRGVRMIIEELLESSVDTASVHRSITQGDCHPTALVGVDTDNRIHRLESQLEASFDADIVASRPTLMAVVAVDDVSLDLLLLVPLFCVPRFATEGSVPVLDAVPIPVVLDR